MSVYPVVLSSGQEILLSVNSARRLLLIDAIGEEGVREIPFIRLGIKQPRAGLSLSVRSAIRIRDFLTCHYCAKTGTTNCGPDGLSWHIDHVVPVSKGGTDAKDNLVLACATCNVKKGTMSYAEFVSRSLVIPIGTGGSTA